jgi:hypothetical protein
MIKAACEQLVKGHAGVSALYMQLAGQTEGAVAAMFQEASEKHRRLAFETSENITIPDREDVQPSAA